MGKEVFIKAVATVVVAIIVMSISVSTEKVERDTNYPPPEFLEGFKVVHDYCRHNTSVDEDTIAEFSDGYPIDDPALKCYMSCLFHELRVVDRKGNLELNKLVDILPLSLKIFFQDIIDVCKWHIAVGRNKCEKAYSWNLCFKTADPVHYFLP